MNGIVDFWSSYEGVGSNPTPDMYVDILLPFLFASAVKSLVHYPIVGLVHLCHFSFLKRIVLMVRIAYL